MIAWSQVERAARAAAAPAHSRASSIASSQRPCRWRQIACMPRTRAKTYSRPASAPRAPRARACARCARAWSRPLRSTASSPHAPAMCAGSPRVIARSMSSAPYTCRAGGPPSSPPPRPPTAHQAARSRSSSAARAAMSLIRALLQPNARAAREQHREGLEPPKRGKRTPNRSSARSELVEALDQLAAAQQLRGRQHAIGQRLGRRRARQAAPRNTDAASGAAARQDQRVPEPLAAARARAIAERQKRQRFAIQLGRALERERVLRFCAPRSAYSLAFSRSPAPRQCSSSASQSSLRLRLESASASARCSARSLLGSRSAWHASRGSDRGNTRPARVRPSRYVSTSRRASRSRSA